MYEIEVFECSFKNQSGGEKNLLIPEDIKPVLVFEYFVKIDEMRKTITDLSIPSSTTPHMLELTQTIPMPLQHSDMS
jgi:hypothetical protein